MWWIWALLVTCSLLQFDAEAGAITMLFHYHKTGHDLIISVSESLVKKQMAQVVPKWKFSFFQGRHGWTHPSVPMPRRNDHWATAHHMPDIPASEAVMQCMSSQHILRRGNFDKILKDPRPVMLMTSSPDFACPDSGTKWGLPQPPRIAHFVRDPWTMAVSSFLYHNQENTPERFVKRFMRPCARNERSHIFLGKVLSLPEGYLDLIYEHHAQIFRRLQLEWFAAHPGTREQTVHHLAEQKKAMEKDSVPGSMRASWIPTRAKKDLPGSYYDLMRTAPMVDTVRMEAARMFSYQSEYMCGNGAADILRMVANFHSIKQNFPDSESFLMSEWTSKDVAVKDAAFNRLLKVICGPDNECAAGGVAQLEAVAVELRQQEDREMAKPSIHHTGGAGVGAEGQTHSSRAVLEQALRDDPVLAPMFDYSHCIVVGNGVPGHACIFNTSALEPARLALGWLSTDGPRKSWTLKRRDENTKGEVV